VVVGSVDGATHSKPLFTIVRKSAASPRDISHAPGGATSRIQDDVALGIAEVVGLERSQKALLPPLLGERKLDAEDARSAGES
jgi:hypothetical protein